jgi:hypothetical protein
MAHRRPHRSDPPTLSEFEQHNIISGDRWLLLRAINLTDGPFVP